MLVEVLHTHPKVLLDGTVIDNPHYMDPTKYPPAARAAAVPRYPLVKVQAGGGEGTDHGWTSLTDAELRVISRVSQGTTNRGVAEELCVSRHTVDAHLKHIYLKLDVHSRVELTVLALQQGLPIG
jgi:DNA-binding CsgD family transcriptional regulator